MPRPRKVDKKICVCGAEVEKRRTRDLRWGKRFGYFDDQGRQHDGVICRFFQKGGEVDKQS